MSYTVNFWGSHPESNNDDCWYGEDYETLEEAWEEYHAKVINRPHCPASDVAFIEIDGNDLYEVRANPLFQPRKNKDDGWKREIANEAGMLHGVNGYNEVMGYD